MTDDERREALEAIASEVRVCTRCRLHTGRRHAVPGEGDPATEVVFVGEGPGATEDEQGRPFVGAAGGLLNELIGAIGWQRREVFITNVVKCRPPGNRDPEPDEIAACSGYLRRQLEVLDPALVVTLGRFSLQTFMPGARISSAHGTVRPVDPATGARDASAMALYHPAAAFRQAALKATLYEDMAGVPDALIASRARRAASAEPVVPEPGNPSGGAAAAADARELESPEDTAPAASGALSNPADVAGSMPLASDMADQALSRPALATSDDPDQLGFF